ncbi:unnamed protein product [Dibothriocephalus latus]|uniref:Uncharacterized protein n=1 Tax=Dibothriocephalus latus TaxID=60516 RepID=A0A3P7LI75_DIBLA|nr:unnamed protein product [Dibothriocephalus latus]
MQSVGGVHIRFNSQTPSNPSTSTYHYPSLVPPPASLASNASTKSPSAVQLWRCSPEDILRNPTSSDSYRYPSLEASTDMDLILLSSIESYGSGSVNSMDWTSMESVSSPVEMRLHGPLPVRNSDELMALRHFIIIKRADWAAFTAECEAGTPICVHTVEQAVIHLLLAAAGHHIPNVRIPILRPNYPHDASRLERERDEIRARDANDPRVGELNGLITKTINDDKLQRWRERVEDFNFRGSSAATWKLLRNLTKTRLTHLTSPLGLGATGNGQIAAKMNQLFYPHSVPPPDISFSANAILTAVKKTKASKAF